MIPLEWKNSRERLGDLVPCTYNPRQLTKDQHAQLTASLVKFNLAEVPAIGLDKQIVAGHQRIRIMMELHGADHIIDVRIPNRPLTKQEFDEYLVRSNRNTGEWDYDVLANNFGREELTEWGFVASDFGDNMNQEPDGNTTPTADGYQIVVAFDVETEAAEALKKIQDLGYLPKLINKG